MRTFKTNVKKKMKKEMRNVKNCINIYEETFVTTKINECDVEYLCQE